MDEHGTGQSNEIFKIYLMCRRQCSTVVVLTWFEGALLQTESNYLLK